ncbi:MAG: hypothetical protein AAGA03_06675 [Planctomycetota bacterium]
MSGHDRKRLSRLPPEHYRDFAWVHWSMTIEHRRTGWLDANFFYKFRELLTHTCFRRTLAVPIFCLMPDHLHVLACGLAEGADQRLAVRQLRTDVNECLQRIGFSLQRQPYDNVLQEEACEQDAIENVMNYIARNPERKGLVPVDGYARYPFTSCLLPGYPRIRLFEPNALESIWRTISYLKRTQCLRVSDPMHSPS